MNRETFWMNDPMHFFTPESWSRFVPMDSMTVPEALNAVLRFTIYFSVILSLFSGKGEYILAIPAVATITVLLYKMYPETQVFKESFTNSNADYTKPTPSNPFMNPSVYDIGKNPDRPSAAPILRPDIAESVENAFAKTTEVYMDTTDRFDMAQSSRAFYTVAGSTVPNDLDAYQEFLNKGNVSSKKSSEGYAISKGIIA